jgi:hypothetical protein
MQRCRWIKRSLVEVEEERMSRRRGCRGGEDVEEKRRSRRRGGRLKGPGE